MSSLYPASEKAWVAMREAMAEDMRVRAKNARVNLLFALHLEFKDNLEARKLIEKYIAKHNV